MKFPAFALTGLLTVALSSPVSAAFSLFDDFNSYANGSQLVGQGPVGNQYALTVGSPTGMVINAGTVVGGPSGPSAAYRNLGPTGLTINNASAAATVFFQFTEGSATLNNWNFVVTDANPPVDTAGSSEVQFNHDSSAGNFRARNGAAFKNLSLDGTPAGNVQVVAGALYNVWFEIENSIDRYRVYMQSDTVPGLASRVQVLANDNTGGTFTFRNSGGGPVANDLININFGPGSGQTVQTIFDNVYVDIAGFNSLNPVPEPSTWALMAGSAATLLAMRRRLFARR